jgi:hypothetical protein
MEQNQNKLAGAYLAKGTIGNVGMPGAPVVDFALVVVPSTHKVSGSVSVRQATENGNYTGHVTGTIYSTGFGNVTQVVGLQGMITPASGEITIEIPFEAHMAIDNSWNGTGGFSYLTVHVDNVPVKPLS